MRSQNFPLIGYRSQFMPIYISTPPIPKSFPRHFLHPIYQRIQIHRLLRSNRLAPIQMPFLIFLQPTISFIYTGIDFPTALLIFTHLSPHPPIL